MAGLAPSLLLALFGAWCGTFAWGTASPAAVAAALSLLGVLFWTGAPWRDPLRLGTAGRLLPLALWVTVAASCWASPVPRAGWMAILLLPAFFGMPAVVERCWRREADRRLGLRALALAVAGISLWAFLDWMILGTPRAAVPLGHHNLLAAWLVILLPLAVLPARETGPWRLAGIAAGGFAILAVLASRSLLGFAALAVEALVGFGARPRSRQGRGWAVLLVLALLVSFLQLPRVLRIATGGDPSTQARTAYWLAGLDGFRTRPLLGWGPGSAAWTTAAFLDPVPRVTPWGESVGELHSLPLQIGYELGFTGLALALGLTVLFFARRIGEREEGRDPALLAAGLLGLGGGALASLGSGAVSVIALPLAAAVSAGAALAGSGRGKPKMGSKLPARIYAVMVLLALAPLELARWHYGRAVATDAAGRGREAESHLAAAVRFDPLFPLYPMRLALLRAREPGRGAAASSLALRAARESGAVAPLWLVAGVLGRSAPSLERACVLDPLNPFAPFYQMLADRGGPDAPAYGAQALLAEPSLAAAVFWERRPDLQRRVLEALRAWPGVDAGWKEALLKAVPPPGERQGPLSRVELLIDTEERESLSLPVFRRRPWPTQWGLIQVRRSTLTRVQLPPAAASKGTSPGFFHSVPCLRRSSRGQSLLTR
ncbi:MAG TPA: O-antigen ligase family protein [Thermoanaerobaculia bacterium]|jgi:O-antigen ligase|nr:O-antigen ligase family protein [Thermoanaerobaculia bacterium]